MIRTPRFQLLAIAFALVAWLSAAAPARAWRTLEEGLWLGEFQPPGTSETDVPAVVALRIDPSRFSLTLLSSSEREVPPLTAEQWAARFDLTAVVNASMYQEDRKTSTGFMKNFGHINNPSVNRRFGAFLAFNRKGGDVPMVQIVERDSPGWKERLERYHTVVQNYRMIGEGGKNLWKPSDHVYSVAAVGLDRQGRVLFIHSRATYSVHRFNEILLELPLDLRNAMYVEGGPQACLYVETGDFEAKWGGGLEGGFLADTGLATALMPNVIGVVERTKAPASGG
jgi:hypothetical protein